MTLFLLITAVVIFACILCNKISSKLGIPILLAFIVLGMVFGTDGILKIPFDNYAFAEQICSGALIFIMFYGGFGTKWNEARPIAGKAILLSSLGTILTAGLVGAFCHVVLKIALLESLLIGSVISSTDAASVFSILRSKRLNLRYHTASLLEVESGSNDPFSYMLTVIVLAMIGGDVSVPGFAQLLLKQIIFGAAFGAGIAGAAYCFLKRYRFSGEGYDSIFMVAVAILAYAAPTYFGGNGYLSVYITGIMLGNLRIPNKQPLVHFFDAITGFMQMLLFFLLGLLSFPSQLPAVALTSLGIALFLTFIARPAAVFLILTPFKSDFRQQLLVAWAGMRGAASIVFAIMVVTSPVSIEHDVFHMIFFIVLFSILIQGTLIPFVARFLNMTDDQSDVMKTFNDYIEDVPVKFIQFTLDAAHPWVDQPISGIVMPPDSILVLLLRGKEKIVPRGDTVLCAGDTLVLSGIATDKIDGIRLFEKIIGADDKWKDKTIAEVSRGKDLIIMVRREGAVIIPRGDTVLREKDIVINYGDALG